MASEGSQMAIRIAMLAVNIRVDSRRRQQDPLI